MTPDYDAPNLAAHAEDIAPAESSPSPIANTFKGPNGMRAGWRLLLFVVFWIATVLAMQFVLLHIPSAAAWLKAQDPHVMTPSTAIVGEALMLFALIVATLLMTLIEKRTYADYHFPLNQAFGKRFWQGVPYGFAMLSLLMALIAAFRGFSLGTLALSGADAFKYGLLFGITFFMVGLFEEFS